MSYSGSRARFGTKNESGSKITVVAADGIVPFSHHQGETLAERKTPPAQRPATRCFCFSANRRSVVLHPVALPAESGEALQYRIAHVLVAGAR